MGRPYSIDLRERVQAEMESGWSVFGERQPAQGRSVATDPKGKGADCRGNDWEGRRCRQ